MNGERVIYNVDFNIPRIVVGLPGRQNRQVDGLMRITPGLTEVVEFWFGNQDGVALNLRPFEIKWVFWRVRFLDETTLSLGSSEIVLTKHFINDAPYSGKCLAILNDEDTLRLGQESSSNLRWGLFLINDQKEVFATSVGRNGTRYGTVVMDIESGIPSAEMIRGS